MPKKALILIDFINEFLHPLGKITPQGMGSFVEQYGTLKNVKKLIDYFRDNNEEIIWIRLGFHENYDNCSTISPRLSGAPKLGILKEGTWSVDFIDALGYNPNEKTITKTRISPFYKTGLEEYLLTKGISEIIVAGVATDLAVSSMARDAHDRDLNVTVISDACATISIEHHEAALIGIRKLVKLLDTGEFLRSQGQ